MQYKIMGWTQTGFTKAYAQNLSVICDLDLWPSIMMIICAKLFSNPTMQESWVMIIFLSISSEGAF